MQVITVAEREKMQRTKPEFKPSPLNLQPGVLPSELTGHRRSNPADSYTIHFLSSEKKTIIHSMIVNCSQYSSLIHVSHTGNTLLALFCWPWKRCTRGINMIISDVERSRYNWSLLGTMTLGAESKIHVLQPFFFRWSEGLIWAAAFSYYMHVQMRVREGIPQFINQ
jgi:hypothetical protein